MCRNAQGEAEVELSSTLDDKGLRLVLSVGKKPPTNQAQGLDSQLSCMRHQQLREVKSLP